MHVVEAIYWQPVHYVYRLFLQSASLNFRWPT